MATSSIVRWHAFIFEFEFDLDEFEWHFPKKLEFEFISNFENMV